MANAPFLEKFQKLSTDFVFLFILLFFFKFGIAAALSLLEIFFLFNLTLLTVQPIIRRLLLGSFSTIYKC